MGTERKCDIDGGGVTFGGTYSFSVRRLRRCIKSGQKTGSDGVKQRLINREGKRTPLVTPLMSAVEWGGGEVGATHVLLVLVVAQSSFSGERCAER
jgi:hypothetical protein